MTIDKKTTPINADHRKLNVGFDIRTPHVRINDDWQQVERHFVALSCPSMPSSRQYPYDVCLIDMAPGTAWNLMKWLQDNEEALKHWMKTEAEQ